MNDDGPDPSIFTTPQWPTLRLLDVGQFIDAEFPPRDMMLDPVLPEQGLAMVFAPRGLGKTFFALGFAHAVATGGPFLRWKATRPFRVLYVDGEMPAKQIQERLQLVLNGAEAPMLDFSKLMILSVDLQGDITLDISQESGQKLIEAHADDADLIVIDNLSSMHLSGHENESADWISMQMWMLHMRRRGKSVLVVHHSNKSGQQRGTSRREDNLDSVIALRRPSDYSPDQGARFEVHLDKARGLFGDVTLPFEAQLHTTTGGARWTTKPLEDVNRAKVIALARQDLSVREIAEETGLSKSKVGRIRKAAEAAGDLDAEGEKPDA